MRMTGVTLSVIVGGFAVYMTSGDLALCISGTRVHSLSVWSGYWLDGIYMRCTGDGGEVVIPPEFNVDPGGGEEGDICAGTAGLESIQWHHTTTQSNDVISYVNITCLGGETHHLADSGDDDLRATIYGSFNYSCEEGKYVKGISYELDYTEETDVNSDSPAYYIYSVSFKCSSSTLDPICDISCSGDTTLLNEEDQPGYCEGPACTAAECCTSNDDSDNLTNEIVVGVITTIIAAMILSFAAWAYRKFSKKNHDQGKEGVASSNIPTTR